MSRFTGGDSPAEYSRGAGGFTPHATTPYQGGMPAYPEAPPPAAAQPAAPARAWHPDGRPRPYPDPTAEVRTAVKEPQAAAASSPDRIVGTAKVLDSDELGHLRVASPSTQQLERYDQPAPSTDLAEPPADNTGMASRTRVIDMPSKSYDGKIGTASNALIISCTEAKDDMDVAVTAGTHERIRDLEREPLPPTGATVVAFHLESPSSRLVIPDTAEREVRTEHIMDPNGPLRACTPQQLADVLAAAAGRGDEVLTDIMGSTLRSLAYALSTREIDPTTGKEYTVTPAPHQVFDALRYVCNAATVGDGPGQADLTAEQVSLIDAEFTPPLKEQRARFHDPLLAYLEPMIYRVSSTRVGHAGDHEGSSALRSPYDYRPTSQDVRLLNIGIGGASGPQRRKEMAVAANLAEVMASGLTNLQHVGAIAIVGAHNFPEQTMRDLYKGRVPIIAATTSIGAAAYLVEDASVIGVTWLDRPHAAAASKALGTVEGTKVTSTGATITGADGKTSTTGRNEGFDRTKNAQTRGTQATGATTHTITVTGSQNLYHGQIELVPAERLNTALRLGRLGLILGYGPEFIYDLDGLQPVDYLVPPADPAWNFMNRIISIQAALNGVNDRISQAELSGNPLSTGELATILAHMPTISDIDIPDLPSPTAAHLKEPIRGIPAINQLVLGFNERIQMANIKGHAFYRDGSPTPLFLAYCKIIFQDQTHDFDRLRPEEVEKKWAEWVERRNGLQSAGKIE